MDQVLSALGFDWQIALANFANFLIIFYLLKRYAFRPIREMLDRRRAEVATGIENARRAETELLMAKQEYERHVAEGKSEANEIIARARLREEAMLEKAEREAAQQTLLMKREAEERIERDRTRMEAEVREKTADLVVAGIEKLLQDSLDVQKQASLAERGIASLNRRNAAA